MKYPESVSESESFGLQEQLSALHDGELQPSDAAALVRASLADDSLMLQWRSMSAIGHVLREQQGSLAKPALVSQSGLPFLPNPTQKQAANDGIFRWKMVAGIAGLAAVGSLVWGLLGIVGDKAGLQSGGVLASNQTVPSATAPGQGLIAVGGQVAGQEVMMIRNPRLDELLAAHKQFGGVSALHQSAGSLRSASLATQRP